MAEQMRAWQYPSTGPVETTIRLVNDAPKPGPEMGKSQVLVQVIACSLNPADYKIQALGIVARAIISYPKTIGMDICARVVAVGDAISDIHPGDAVFGRIDPFGTHGGLSEYAVADRSRIAILDPGIDPVQACSLPTAALTAYQTIAPHIQAGRGDRIFINGGSGGLGTFGIQIAKILGCHVTVSCSTAKLTLCRELGADEIIDYKTTDVTERLKHEGRVFRLVVDNVGNAPADLFSSSNGYLQEGCPYVFAGGNTSCTSVTKIIMASLLPRSLGGAEARFVPFMTKDSEEDLATLSEWLSSGKLRVIIDRVFEFDEAKTAIQYIRKGSSGGKAVVKVRPAEE